MPALDARPSRDRLVRLHRSACRVAAASLLFAVPSAAGEPTAESLLLRPGLAIERELSAGGAGSFHANLTGGSHWLVRVEQLGIDVVVEITDPQGQRLFAVDGPIGRWGTESLLLRPEGDGRYGITVRCEKQRVPAGNFEMSLQELPAETREDRLRLRAEEALSDATLSYPEPAEGSKGRAIAKMREALDAWRVLGERRHEARTWFLIGSLADQIEDYRQAVAGYRQALTVWRQLGDSDSAADALDRLGLTHKYLGETSQALETLEEALALRQRLGQRQREAETRGYLCLVLQRLGRGNAAGACYEKTLAMAREFADSELEATVLNNLGGIYQNLGEPAKQLEMLQLALELRRAIGDAMGEGVTLNNLGAFHRRLGEIEKAQLHYSSALAIFERLGSRYWQARTLNNIGFAYLSLGELERARAYLLRALPLRREVGDAAGETVTLLNLGRTVAGLEKTGLEKTGLQKAGQRGTGPDETGQQLGGTALQTLRTALARSLAADNQRSAATARQLLGERYMESGDTAAASREIELTLASWRRMGNRRLEAEALELSSRLHLHDGDARQAKALAEQALELHRAVRSAVGEIAALATLARAHRRLGELGAVRESLDAAISGLEALHGRLGDPNQRASFLATGRQVYELRVDFLMELHRSAPSMGHDLAALEASEGARSRSLLALLESNGSGIPRDAPPELSERLRAAQRRFAAKSRRQLEILSREHTQAQALTVEQELYESLSELDNVRAEIRRSHPRDAALSRPQTDRSTTLSAAAIRGLLDPGTVLLEIFLGERRSFLWWVTQSSITAHELPPRQEIEELAEQVHRQTSAIYQRSAEDRQALDALGRMLLGPVADRLEAQRLVVVADGALHFVPFAALTLPRTDQPGSDQPGSGQPVLNRHEVVILPSASVLAVQRRELAGSRPTPTPATTSSDLLPFSFAETPTVAIFADPIFARDDPRLGARPFAERGSRAAEAPFVHHRAHHRDAVRSGLETLVRLPHTRSEAEAIAALVPADQLLLALGGEARRSRVIADELSPYRILHFATHGLVNPRTPELSGLMLARHDASGSELDGFLGFTDVAGLDLSAELVVLSGCRTALGKQIRGEGLIGLTRSFLYAGVPRVVASLWQVRDQATAELMAHFYRAMLIENLPPAAALRSAQLALRQERRFRDPYYWAAFTLQGDWR